jgi:predicted DNA-binding transcriptional regulator YafY
MADLTAVTFTYCNYKNEIETRKVRPIRIYFGSTAYHPDPQWLLEAWDVDRNATRDFAMSGILGSWSVFKECP